MLLRDALTMSVAPPFTVYCVAVVLAGLSSWGTVMDFPPLCMCILCRTIWELAEDLGPNRYDPVDTFTGTGYNPNITARCPIKCFRMLGVEESRRYGSIAVLASIVRPVTDREGQE